MARLVVGIFRMLPLIVILLIIGALVYLAIKKRKNSAVAKELLIKLTFWINAILSCVLLLIMIYALIDKSDVVIELSGACLCITAFFFIISLICKSVFLKHRPNYPWKRSRFFLFFKK